MAVKTIRDKDGVLAYNTGTWEAPVWVPIPNCHNHKATAEKDEIEVTSRATGGVETFELGNAKYMIEWEMLLITNENGVLDPQIAFFRNAHINETVVELWSTDRGLTTDKSGGPHFQGKISKCTPIYDQKGITRYSFVAKPCWGDQLAEFKVYVD